MKTINNSVNNTTATVASNANPLYVKLWTIVPVTNNPQAKQARVFINQKGVMKASAPVWVMHSIDTPQNKVYKKKYIFFDYKTWEQKFQVYNLTNAKNRILEMFSSQRMAAIRKSASLLDNQLILSDSIVNRDDTLNQDLPM